MTILSAVTQGFRGYHHILARQANIKFGICLHVASGEKRMSRAKSEVFCNMFMVKLPMFVFDLWAEKF
jgi:hypothetical protein